MNKKISFLIIGLFFLFLNSCKKKSDKPSSIELIGPDLLKVFCGDLYSDPGALVLNSKGVTIGKATSNWCNQVAFNTLGTYLVTYSALDKNNNEILKTRYVNVGMAPRCYLGDYDCKWLDSSSTDSLSAITTISAGVNLDEISIQSLGGVGNFSNVKVYGQYGDTISYYFSTNNTAWWNQKYFTGTTKNFGKTIVVNYSSRDYSTYYNYDKKYILTRR